MAEEEPIQQKPGKTQQQQQMEQSRKIQDNLKRIRHKLVVMSGKGGVGKSTVAVNLATVLAEAGKKVGIMDIDIHGPNIPKMLGIEDAQIQTSARGIGPVIPQGNPNLKVMSMAFLLDSTEEAVIWRGPLKIGLIRQFLSDVDWGDLDYLIVDLPPGTGDEPLSIAQNIPNDSHAVIVTTPQEVSLLDVSKSVNFARQLKMKIAGIIENMSGFSCPYCGEAIDIFKSGGGERLAMKENIPFLGGVPMDADIVISGDRGRPFVAGNEDSPAGKAFRKIVSKIRGFLGDTEINTDGKNGEEMKEET